jgi:glucokinase
MSYAIGIDVGGTKVLGGVVDDNGKIHSTARKDTPRQGGAALTQTIADTALELMVQFDVTKFGAGRNQNHMMMLTVGTGIGGGIVVNGDLYRGAFGIAAEFGHLRVVPDGHLCGCGARGCFEQYASGNALLRHAREAISASPEIARNLLSRGDGTIAGLTGQAITDAAREGDPVALAAFNTTGQWLGAGIASLSVLLDPSCVVIGGGVIDAGEILLKPTREALERTMPFAGKHPYPTLIAAELGNEAGLVGVADLARN